MTLQVTILGSGSSGGVPRIGGPDGTGYWGACDPANPKNRRRRCSLLVRRKSNTGTTAVLVDTSPDMREQLLSAHVSALDAVFISHDHADQLHGIDDLRMIAINMRKRVDVYASETAFERILTRFGYCFAQPQGSDYPAILNAHDIREPFQTFDIRGEGGAIPVLPFWMEHGQIRSMGFRFGPVAYSSDVNGLDSAAFKALEGVECWIVDALRYTPHPSHAHVDLALEWIAHVKPKRAILTNLHVDLDYETLKKALPSAVEPAYDGLKIDLDI
jgi:phosphoribosyl 1,2-cyclic phosphate phosphodiesterase